MKFIIDAGHGPETAGKRSPNGMREYEFNSSVAAFLTEKLLTLNGISVTHVHSDQRDIPLKTRTDQANKLKANCYISIHANAYGTGWNTAQGIETYVYPSKPREAWELAKKIQDELIKATGRKNRGVKTANFHVLRETEMTAVLIECGFMTNKEEADLLQTTAYRKLCAQAIFSALKEFYRLEWTEIPTTKILYRVQAGAFTQYHSAEKLAKELKAKGFDSYITKTTE